jgi:general stress protein CsbA
MVVARVIFVGVIVGVEEIDSVLVAGLIIGDAGIARVTISVIVVLAASLIGWAVLLVFTACGFLVSIDCVDAVVNFCRLDEDAAAKNWQN